MLAESRLAGEAAAVESSAATSKRQRRVKSDEDCLVPSAVETALRDLEVNGYFWLKRVVPEDLCEKCARVIQKDVGGRLDAGSKHQEEPIERLNEETGKVMKMVRDFVLNRVLNEQIGMTAVVPRSWTDTLYGRVKRKYFHTKWHCDAFNTVFQRGLLEIENLQDVEVSPNPAWAAFRKGGMLTGNWKDVPIFTFWVALRPVDTSSSSHLRIYPKSHNMPGIHLREDLRNVVPDDFRYSATHFKGPNFPGGYSVGDIVVFHCLTQHEANAHSVQVGKGKKGNGERVSLDGRFFYRLDLHQSE